MIVQSVCGTFPKTLLEMAGADLTPATLQDASLLLIDMQNEYVSGPLQVGVAQSAANHVSKLLASARSAGTPIIHVVHAGSPGGLFDLGSERGQIIDAVQPLEGETIIRKSLPNAFAGTNLDETLKATERTRIIVVGFMTHMCVSATARAALDHGYAVTIDANGCGTRDLPDGQGGVADAASVHNIALAELADRFAIVVRNANWWI